MSDKSDFINAAIREKIEREKGCSGCIHRGEYENEIEYGYACPCLLCSRRSSDNYCPNCGTDTRRESEVKE